MKRKLLAGLGAAACILILLAVLIVVNRGGSTPTAEVSFSLNGQDYPLSPVLRDFLDRGWTVDQSAEQVGSYTKEKGPSNLVVSGYYLTCGDNSVRVSLDTDECRAGVSAEECHVRSVGLYGWNVESFRLNGRECATVNSDQLVTYLGDTYTVTELEDCSQYIYSLPENGISEIYFFINSSETVGQIFVIFDPEIGDGAYGRLTNAVRQPQNRKITAAGSIQESAAGDFGQPDSQIPEGDPYRFQRRCGGKHQDRQAAD